MVARSSGLPSLCSDSDCVSKKEADQDSNLAPSAGKDAGSPFTEDRKGGPRHKVAHNLEPLRNQDGNFICAHRDRQSQCETLTFERKCDWTKHMDKHDRPYKCEELVCRKLRGFTYLGGLLRHQREVHKRGTGKNTFYCLFPYCKRNAGVGFTRRENLNEHMKRVHQPLSGPMNDASSTLQTEAIEKAVSEVPPILHTSRMVVVPATVNSIYTKKRKACEDTTDYVPLVGADIGVELVRLQRKEEDNARQNALLQTQLRQRDLRISDLEQKIELLCKQGGRYHEQ